MSRGLLFFATILILLGVNACETDDDDSTIATPSVETPTPSATPPILPYAIRDDSALTQADGDVSLIGEIAFYRTGSADLCAWTGSEDLLYQSFKCISFDITSDSHGDWISFEMETGYNMVDALHPGPLAYEFCVTMDDFSDCEGI